MLSADGALLRFKAVRTLAITLAKPLHLLQAKLRSLLLQPCVQLTSFTRAAASAAAEALEDFAAGLDADPAGVLPLWTAKSHPCGDSSNNFRPWPGITCNAPTGYVTEISLCGKGLSGKLPEGLSVLNTLRSL
jgi:hypothetical protein